MRIALISDIHGNSWALDAVLEDVRTRAVDGIFDLGDTVNGSLDPRGTAERLIAERIPSVRGNGDREVTPTTGVPTDWLTSFPATRTIEEVLLCHGTPSSDVSYLLETVSRAGVTLATTEAILQRLGQITENVVACGHSHITRTVALPNGTLVVNPGSVGLPAYTDNAPFPHAMEAGSPHARYAILTGQRSHWTVEHIAVTYDWHSAAAAARNNDRPSWERWIQTGRASVSIEE